MHKQSWIAAGVFGVAGALIPGGVYLSGGVLNGPVVGQVAVAGLAAALTGGLCWRLLALVGNVPPSKWVAAAVGAVVGLLAHVPFWYLLFLAHWAFGEPFRTRNLSHPLHMLYIAPLLAFFSCVTLGWITAPVGAATGFLLAGTPHRAQSSSAPPD